MVAFVGVQIMIKPIRFSEATVKAGKDVPKKGDKKEKAVEPPPPNLANIAVCNAAGALHHLTFLDEAKIEVWGC